jgi:serine/alanine adding enzyme
MSIRIVNSLQEDVWRRFVDRHPAGSIFHTPEMFEVFNLAEGHRPTLWAAVNDDQSPLALLLPVEITLMNGFLRHLTTRAVVYGSILWESSEEGLLALKSVLKTYTHESSGPALFTELRNLADLASVQPILREYHFVYEDYLDFLIDLDCPPDELLNRIGPRTRKNIRSALNRRDITVEELTDVRQLKVWYEVLRKTYSHAAVPLAKYSLFEAAFELLVPKGMVRFTQARVGPAVAATSVELLYKHVMYGWYGGVDRSFSRYPSNELLMWHILAWGALNGYTVYDFGGAGQPHKEYGVRDFKAKFGGRQVSYGRNSYTHRPVRLWLSKISYQLARRWL